MKSISFPLRRLSIFSLSRSAVIELIAGALIVLFLYTGLSKLYEHFNFYAVLLKSPVFSRYATFMSWAVPIIEILVSGLLLISNTRKLALYLSLFMMVAFTVYMAYLIYFTPKMPCSCGGVITLLSPRQHLVFNIGFTLLALTGVLLARKSSTKSPDSK
ncbi:MauE/DoxX family redox-associated membrane protein [Pseudoflavitalea rhizosphaerae]|uniref:MauE/DoxX family redox-associated membrane protein n=1 Tax=Pseudoflavitalea rhizosphaerae TaxID=1884793 RepID=UPI000F8DFABA|nr:MauE/DoxX family redox-associated membrane protein [Pseudoflavitalea rhizosphaerae]